MKFENSNFVCSWYLKWNSDKITFVIFSDQRSSFAEKILKKKKKQKWKTHILCVILMFHICGAFFNYFTHIHLKINFLSTFHCKNSSYSTQAYSWVNLWFIGSPSSLFLDVNLRILRLDWYAERSLCRRATLVFFEVSFF